jgi:hypothetical protein
MLKMTTGHVTLGFIAAAWFEYRGGLVEDETWQHNVDIEAAP